MRSFLSFLGFLFEAAFKSAFMEGKLPKKEYVTFIENLLKTLDEVAIDGATGAPDSKVRQVLEKLRPAFRHYQPGNPPPELQNLRRLSLHPLSDHEETSDGFHPTWKELYMKLIFLLGKVAGYFYGKQHSSIPLKYTLGEESDRIIWQNADLLFLEDKVLHVIDFKLGGAQRALRILLREEKPRIPIFTPGLPVNLASGELEFSGFLEKLLQAKDKLRETEKIFGENKGLLQVACYAADFLYSRSEEVKEVSLELIYPISDPLCLRFGVENREKVSTFLPEIKRLYQELKGKESEHSLISNQATPERKERLRKEWGKKIALLREEMRQKQHQVHEIHPDPISECRADVRKRIAEFMKDPEPCKVIALLHSAGSGKTSATREAILQLPGKHIILYMATRIILLEREAQKINTLKKKTSNSIEVVYERRQYSSSRYARHRGDHWSEAPNAQQKGKLYATVERIGQLARQPSPPDQIWAFTTIQSIVNIEKGRGTSKHLTKLLSERLEDYHIHIILDEFFGYRNGLFAISELLSFLEELKKCNRKGSLYLFDANGYSPNLLEKLIREYEKYQVIPECIMLTPYQEELEIKKRSIPIKMCAKHGYPAKTLFIHRKFIEVKDDQQFVENVAEYIASTLDKQSTGFAFIQDKEAIVKIAFELEKLGLSSLSATASSKKSQEQINTGNQDIILGTSSVSRGLDFSREHKPVDCLYAVIQSWGVENNLVELIQAISRSRGDERTEGREKHLHLIYILDKRQAERTIENLRQMEWELEEEDKYLIQLMYEKEFLQSYADLDSIITRIIEYFLKKPEGPVLVPVPTQHTTVFRHNIISEYENIMNFLEDIIQVESSHGKGETLSHLRNLKKILEKSIYLHAILNESDILNEPRYFHPYVLLDRKKIIFNYDESTHRSLIRLFSKVEDKLKEHNRERCSDLRKFLEELLPHKSNTAPLLLPVYSWIWVKNWLQEDEEKLFRVSKRVGRGHAEVLGGALQLNTRCSRGYRTEYACIPLEEDYPYQQVLSGRFAKFTTNFVRNLLR